MAMRIQLRRGTSAEWTHANPVLAEGESGLETDTGNVKYGDGVRPWAELPYSVAVPGPGEVIVGSEDGPVARDVSEIGASAPMGSLTDIIGDSIAASAAPSDPDTQSIHRAASVATALALYSGGRIVLRRNRGIGGQTTAQILARLDTDIIAHTPDTCIVIAGTNDLPGGNLTQCIANLTEMWTRLKAAGIAPIAALLPPNATYAATVPVWNARIREKANELRVPVIDLYAATADPATGGPAAGMASDTVHPTVAGAMKMGEYAAQTIPQLMPDAGMPLAVSNVDGANMVLNGLFLTGTDGLPEHWYKSGLATPGDVAMESDPEIAGQWLVINRTTPTGTHYVADTLTGGFAAGDVLEMGCRVQVTNPAGGFNGAVSVSFNSVAAAAARLYDLTTPMDGMIRLRFKVPGGATDIRPAVSTGAAGTGTIRVAQFTVRNLTALGLA